jgi:hypothetical protein
MKDKNLEKIIPKLIGNKPMDYDLKSDGLLVVIDAEGKKRSIPPAEYWSLLNEGKALSVRKKEGGKA